MASYGNTWHLITNLLILLGKCWMTFALFGEPCKTPLGFGYGDHDEQLSFDVSVSNGKPEDVRLNAPTPWTPDFTSLDNIVRINTSKPILLTGLQLQGNNKADSWISTLSLETSLDCEVYDSQVYNIPSSSGAHSVVVSLTSMMFASCLRLRPTMYTGHTPTMSLELLGCVISDSDNCQAQLRPKSESWLAGDGRELTYPHELVLSWIRLTLHLAEPSALDDVDLYYSRDCLVWESYNQSNLNVVIISSKDNVTRWVTLNLDTPVRARCLRIFPPMNTTIGELRTNGCSSRVTSRLQSSKLNNKSTSGDTPSTTTEKSTTQQQSSVFGANTIRQTVMGSSEEGVAGEKNTISLVDDMVKQQTQSQPSSGHQSPNQPSSGHQSPNQQSRGFTHPDMSSRRSVLTSILSKKKIKQNIPNSVTKEKTTDSVFTGTKDDTNVSVRNMISSDITLIRDDTDDHKSENTLFLKNSSSDDTLLDVIYFDEDTDDILDDTDKSIDDETINNSVSENSTTDDIEITHVTQCGVRHFTPSHNRTKRVISGHRNEAGEWPWLVSLHYLLPVPFTQDSGFNHLCGASLVSDDWLISASHCFDNFLFSGMENVSHWEVNVGIFDQALQGTEPYVQKRNISAIIKHPDHDTSDDTPYDDDIVLIKLESPIDFDDYVSPICVDRGQNFTTESHCMVSGWGQLSHNTSGSRYPYTAPITLRSRDKCNETYTQLSDDHIFKNFSYVSPSNICGDIGTEGEDTCQGDSGGPLMCEMEGRWYLVGIVVGGYLCGQQGFPGFYTNVSYFNDWIRDSVVQYDIDHPLQD